MYITYDQSPGAWWAVCVSQRVADLLLAGGANRCPPSKFYLSSGHHSTACLPLQQYGRGCEWLVIRVLRVPLYGRDPHDLRQPPHTRERQS